MTGNDSIELVALDADDTLWHNEPMYTSARERFCALLSRYEPAGIPDERLHQVEMRNLQRFGYGVKGFVLSMIETARRRGGASRCDTDRHSSPRRSRCR